MNKTIELQFYGIEMQVNTFYNKYIPATYDQPAEGGDFEVHDVLVCGNSIMPIIRHSALDELTRSINENRNDYI